MREIFQLNAICQNQKNIKYGFSTFLKKMEISGKMMAILLLASLLIDSKKGQTLQKECVLTSPQTPPSKQSSFSTCFKLPQAFEFEVKCHHHREPGSFNNINRKEHSLTLLRTRCCSNSWSEFAIP